MPRPRHSSSGGGIVKAKFGGKLVKKLQRKNKSNKNKNLPYLKPFLMAILSRRKHKQCINGGLAVCVKKAAKTACVKEEAAKICHSPKLDDRFPMTDQEVEDLFLKIKKSYMNKVPTYSTYSGEGEEQFRPWHFPTFIQHYNRIIRSNDK